jgi:hypothetical protein
MTRHLLAGSLVMLLAATVVEAQTPAPAAKRPPKPSLSNNILAPTGMLLGRFDVQHPSDSLFGTVYGSAMIAFGVEFRARVVGRLFVSGALGRLGKQGVLTVTGDPSTLTIYPMEGMALYALVRGRVSPYVGGGGGAYKYTETNTIGTADGMGYGFVVCGGVTARFGRFVVDGGVKYHSAKVTPLEDQANLGGLRFGIGAGIAF